MVKTGGGIIGDIPSESDGQRPHGILSTNHIDVSLQPAHESKKSGKHGPNVILSTKYVDMVGKGKSHKKSKPGVPQVKKEKKKHVVKKAGMSKKASRTILTIAH